MDGLDHPIPAVSFTGNTGNGEGFSLLLLSPEAHPNPRFWKLLSQFSWKIWSISGGICSCEFQRVGETIPNQLECGRNVWKSLFLCWKHIQPPLLSRIWDAGANPCIREGCEEWDLEHKMMENVSKSGNSVLSQISQVCQLCQQSPRLFSNHAAQLHTLLVSFWEFHIPPGIPEGRFPGNNRICIIPCCGGSFPY